MPFLYLSFRFSNAASSWTSTPNLTNLKDDGHSVTTVNLTLPRRRPKPVDTGQDDGELYLKYIVIHTKKTIDWIILVCENHYNYECKEIKYVIIWRLYVIFVLQFMMRACENWWMAFSSKWKTQQWNDWLLFRKRNGY